MKKIGIIPLRRDSKSILGKNKRKMLGRPLFAWVLAEAILSDLDEVIVFTNDQWILDFLSKEYAWTRKLRPLKRNENNADDFASTESALKECTELIQDDYEVICLLQATSPLTRKEDINGVLALVVSDEYDSALSVVRQHRFVWELGGIPSNYNPANRPRRQDYKGFLCENGAIYATRRDAFQASGIRISGKTGLFEMPLDTYVELDELQDWIHIESLLDARLRHNKGNGPVKMLVLDVDGVFTDGGVHFGMHGEFSKRFDIRDGMGLEALREEGISVMVLTSEVSDAVKKRMEKLGIDLCYMGVKDKYAFLLNELPLHKLSFVDIAYLGDDRNDLAPLCAAGWSLAPSDAMDVVKRKVDLVLNKPGGRGAIREACEFLIRYKSRFY